ncbi:hypothetical protein NQ317_016663 [Molorchus minor]|uniref:Uncharacterized protein n=1 Tax=Molorchus minor TaxID=1323400 RepID=A0ABQ9JRW1_9CUCU|nr:hypothetical protein NQ317_016663 [Molorchus minor]
MASRRVLLKDLKKTEIVKSTEKKSVLQQRLRDVLHQEGEDPDTYLFEMDEDIKSVLRNMENLEEKMLENTGNLKKHLEEKIMENSGNLEKNVGKFW